MNIYPYTSPLVLTDNIFTLYGGQTGTTLPAQRTASYLIAEKQATEYIGTFLVPTIITGTFPLVGSRRLATDYGYVSRILSAKVISQTGHDCDLKTTDSCVFIWQDTFGYMDIGGMMSACGCSSPLSAYQFQLAYEAGLPTGVAANPAILLALTMAATINLNEMTFPSANESTGDIGIESYSSLDYSERRKKLKRTVFGSSAVANKIANLLDGAVRKARRALVL